MLLIFIGEQGLEIEARLLGRREGVSFRETSSDVLGVVEFYPEPVPPMLLRCLVSGAAPAEWVEDQIARVSGNEDGTFWNDQLEFVDARPNFEFPVSVR